MNLLNETRSLVEAAIKSGLSTRQIADNAGVSQRYLSKVRNPDEFNKGEYESLQKLYDYLSSLRRLKKKRAA